MKWLWGLIAFVLMSFAYAKTETSIDRAQEQARVHTDLASRYYQVGQVSTAVDEAKIALNSAADYVPAHMALALIYAQLYQNDLADQHFVKALNAAAIQKRSETDIRNSYAWYLCGSGRGEQALQEFAVVLRDPLYASMDKALINAGTCAAKLQRDDLALPYLDAAIDVNAKNAVAYIYRAHAWINVKRYSDARADMRKAGALLSVEPPELLWLKVRLAYVQGVMLMDVINELKLDYPTSAQANWIRAGQYNIF